MPYIKKIKRPTAGSWPQDAGELNFAFTRLINDYMGRYKAREEFGYQTLNDIVGALEGAKMEFYRRVVVPYENSKMETNGDVY